MTDLLILCDDDISIKTSYSFTLYLFVSVIGVNVLPMKTLIHGIDNCTTYKSHHNFFICRDIYIQRERELLDELLSVGEICGQWQSRQLELVSTHVSLLKHYCHSRRCMVNMEKNFFKASSRKGTYSRSIFNACTQAKFNHCGEFIKQGLKFKCIYRKPAFYLGY